MLTTSDFSIDFNAKNQYIESAQVAGNQRKLAQYDPGFLDQLKKLGIEIPVRFRYVKEHNSEDDGW